MTSTTSTAAFAALRPDASELDQATRQRIELCEATADLLEVLVEERAWSRLDVAIAAELSFRGRRLVAFLEHAASTPVIAAVEERLLGVRRMQRRMQVALDLLGEHPDAVTTPAETDADGGPAAPAAPESGAPWEGGFRRPARGQLARAPSRNALRKQRRGRAASIRRLAMVAAAGALVVVLSMAIRGLQITENAAAGRTTPPIPLAAQEYLDELQVFMPVTHTLRTGQGMNLVVARQWLLQPEAARREQARGAHVFLSNRNIPHVTITWDDGTPVATFDGRGETWLPGSGVTPR